MDQLTRSFPPPGRIDLAREPDFVIGRLSVRPSRCEVETAGDRRILQRRVMQVLVALAHSTTEVVSQQELILRCWGGLAVSDDAIGRCIGQLRRLAVECAAEPPFEIETIPGVGYRLSPTAATVTAIAATARTRRPLLTRPRLAAGLVAGLVMAAGAWAIVRWLDRPLRLATPVVEVRPFGVIGADPALRPLAARAADAIAGFLGDSDVRIVSGPTPAASAPLAFDGAVSSSDGRLRLRLTLEDKRSGTSLWSRDYVEPAARAEALIEEAEGGAMETVNLVRPSFGPSGLLLNSETLVLGVQGGEEAVSPTFGARNDSVHDFGQALARAPSSGILRAAYSNALAFAGMTSPPAERDDLLKRARAEAERTIREHHAQSGLAYLTLLLIEQSAAPRDWVSAQARLDAALKAAPEEPFLYGYACDFLVRVGRALDSLYYCRRALALRPHTAPLIVEYAQAIDIQGDHPQVADQLLEEGARLYPDSQMIRVYRFGRDAFAGPPDRALALMHDPDATPPIPPEDIRAIDLLEKARKSASYADAEAAMAAMRSADAHQQFDDFRFLFPMALGRMDQAFAAPDLVLRAEEPEEELLTLHFTEPLRRDARYWPLAAKAGLVRYWRTTGKWPDFCSDPSYPLDCRAEARRVAAGA